MMHSPIVTAGMRLSVAFHATVAFLLQLLRCPFSGSTTSAIRVAPLKIYQPNFARQKPTKDIGVSDG
jgi:hypothetical protein